MTQSTHFPVAPKLADVLGENYTSSEKSLDELIDNAWDVKATKVYVIRQMKSLTVGTA